jgi:glycosyltransferase involved in cell wall biosynthesis
MNPLVSIVIVNYNYERFIAEAIRSALNQTYKPLEVIVVDDGSTDGSRAIIESFGETIIPIFKENGGQGSAYNAGFDKSRGDYILFLDSDDALEPNAVEQSVRFFAPGVSKVQFYLRVLGDASKPGNNLNFPTSTLSDGDVSAEVIRCGAYCSPPASGNIYSREALAQIMPMPAADWRICADTYTIFLCAFLGKVRACPQVLGLYRVHGSNWYAASMNASLVRSQLQKSQVKDDLLVSFCSKRSIPYKKGTAMNDVGYFKLRLSSLLLDPKNHPYRSDHVSSLVWQTAKLSWQDVNARIPKKMMATAWAFVAAAAPRKYRMPVIEWGLVPQKRSGMLSRFTKAT